MNVVSRVHRTGAGGDLCVSHGTSRAAVSRRAALQEDVWDRMVLHGGLEQANEILEPLRSVCPPSFEFFVPMPFPMLMDCKGEDRIRATYQENFDKLVKLKERYDPGNFFRVNQNIRPHANSMNAADQTISYAG
jgi:hypothetical protein